MQKLNKTAILKRIEKSQMREDLPEFRAGDTISVHIKIVEGNKTRVQKLDGIVLKITGKGLSKSFTIRKESSGIGVEETFSYHSPLIVKIEVSKRGKVRRAYISYMRQRSGKSARIKTKN
ncbi:MAG: 50S ribosomal protein L19 [Mycoplasmataceae bacterium]|jgi:large subunit ribosomal protein L19|nr:50S ribosomal protein L19 [Mycoplasmataceae bacterium]